MAPSAFFFHHIDRPAYFPAVPQQPPGPPLPSPALGPSTSTRRAPNCIDTSLLTNADHRWSPFFTLPAELTARRPRCADRAPVAAGGWDHQGGRHDQAPAHGAAHGRGPPPLPLSRFAQRILAPAGRRGSVWL
jgi:hypothetical protein